jgi:hypothetical protein
MKVADLNGSYFAAQYPSGDDWNCDIFRNSLAGNVGNDPTLVGKNGTFFDRGCEEHLPVSFLFSTVFAHTDHTS